MGFVFFGERIFESTAHPQELVKQKSGCVQQTKPY